MFPLGSVLFPAVPMPLHIFEPRYRKLTEDILAAYTASADETHESGAPVAVPEFGVVLIERGSEVGGGDHRFTVGTVAAVREAGMFEDGRWMLETIGTRRVRVLEWLPDAPYPHAMVQDLDEPTDGTVAGIEAAVSALRRVLALSIEAGDDAAPATIEFSDDPQDQLWQACAVAPLGPMDKQILLGTESNSERISLLNELLRDAGNVLAHRLTNG
jgi:uncharacterized protein